MILICIVLLVGMIFSKIFREGLFGMLGSVVLYAIVVFGGIMYNLVYAPYKSIKDRSLKVFFKTWFEFIVKIFRTIGEVMETVALKFDVLGVAFMDWKSNPEDNRRAGDKRLFGEQL